MEIQKTSNKKTGAGEMRLSDFRLYYKATVIKSILALSQNKCK